MNLNIYVEDNLGLELTNLAKSMGKTRNSIIREALKEWIQHNSREKWPGAIKKFQGIKDVPRFESYRDELSEPDEDPFK